MLREVEDARDVSPAKSVYALRIVAHYTDTRLGRGEQAEYLQLRHIRVLILVHKDTRKSLAVFVAHFFVLEEQAVGKEQNVVEIECIGHAQAVLIHLVNAPQLAHSVAAITVEVVFVGGIVSGQLQEIFGFRYAPGDGRGFVCLVVEAEVFHDFLDGAQGVARVVNGKIARNAYGLALYAQDTAEQAVERAAPHGICALGIADSGNTPIHFPRRLVGEREGENAPRFHAVGDKPCNLIGQHARLARTSSSHHKRGAVVIANGLKLLFIQLRAEFFLQRKCHWMFFIVDEWTRQKCFLVDEFTSKRVDETDLSCKLYFIW